MCLAKAPKPPPPVVQPSPPTAEQVADQTRKRLSVRQGYAASIRTSQDGAAGFGRNAQVPGLSSGTATKMGAAA